MNLTQGMSRAVQRKPEGIATRYKGRRHTFRQLQDRVARLPGA